MKKGILTSCPKIAGPKESEMKLELRVLNGGLDQPQETAHAPLRQGGSDEAVIDIAQVLAANQTLLKNMIRKVESLETRLGGMMEYIAHQQQERLMEEKETRLLLSAPLKKAESWRSDSPPLDRAWYSRFDFWTRWFDPAKMRRPGTDS